MTETLHPDPRRQDERVVRVQVRGPNAEIEQFKGEARVEQIAKALGVERPRKMRDSRTEE